MSRPHKVATLGEHNRWGAELVALRGRLQALHVEIANTLPLDHDASTDLASALVRIDRARSRLEDEMLKGAPEAPLTVYYPLVGRATR